MKEYNSSITPELAAGLETSEHRLERITGMMIAKYGENALSKAVRAAKFYAGENDTHEMRMWINIGERIKQHEEQPAREAETVQ